ncbi:type II CRISPR RNA-guided endonuclease Cas9 [Chitinophaga alhagiae]|uniref:type II CRISPR RNA-guided endonuclease Cas9 n=1 Tax=Chitinophaga alhagiae TaxID=2203219 RepID=UPI000E5AF424|nr:type II CRISPR RNA-guided endonuclease Cas9 [Chitinophaga alhagiae]
MKKILGLDVGTNSIGWAVISLNQFGQEGAILGLGSRIIPMDGDAMQKFESGATVSKTADRRMARMARRLKQRFRLRRTRLITALKTLGWMPDGFPVLFREAKSFSMRQYLPFDASIIAEAQEAFGSKSISEDWIVYYLRTKALEHPIPLSGLVRILYMMNQRRGFRSSRKDEKDEEQDEIKYPLFEKWVQILTVSEITEVSEEKGIKTLNVTAGDITGQIKRRAIPDWVGQEMELEVTRKTTKAGEVTYTFAMPDPTDWEKKKTALEKSILKSGHHPGEYFFHHLISDPNYRIRQNIIDRSLYEREFEAIWKKQATFHPELADTSKLPAIADLLYKNNAAKQKELCANDLYYLFSRDIIYYQRPLRSQKHSVGHCSLEKKGNGYGIKVAPKSSPEFQEFRIWQTIHNLKALELSAETEGKPLLDVDATEQHLTDEKKALLFALFDSRESVSHHAILKELGLNTSGYRLNYPSDRDFQGNETKAVFRKVFKKHAFDAGNALLDNADTFYRLWHILYSLNSRKEIASALSNPKHAFGLPEAVIAHLSKLPDLPKQYAAFSSKAIRKMLPLMRCGQYFNWDNIPVSVKTRIDHIVTGEYALGISDDARDKIASFNLRENADFKGLSVPKASYVAYNRHSERENSGKYEAPDDINVPLLIPNNSLRNPVVEQVIKECLSLVKDVWAQYGQPAEIHIELARELKKTAEEREKADKKNRENEADRKRIRAILRELQNANPNSPADIERIRLWENTGNETARSTAVRFSKEPTRSEIERYKLWGEQNHISPYTGKVIPLSKLFTPEYEVEHIIPRSRFFDDSFLNKTICETCVNDFKGNRTARQLIETDGGRTITHKGHTFTLMDTMAYYAHCQQTFQGGKYRNLMREDIPNDFIQRQINDTRYITRKLAELLYPVAREKEGIVFTIGQITSELKDKWGLNRVWKEILLPRFERLEQITGEPLIQLDTAHNNIHFKTDYKRIDHRHHALDALIIACTTRQHIQYLNSLNATDEAGKYRYLVKSRYSDFVLPWESFTKEAREKLQQVIVSHKNRNRLLSKAVNRYSKWVQTPEGTWKKQLVKQEKGPLTAIRKSMFKEPLGKITLREYKDVTLKQAVDTQLKALQGTTRDQVSQVADASLRKQLNELLKNCAYNLKEAEKHLKKYPLLDGDGKALSKIRVTVFNNYAAKRVTLDSSFTADKIGKIPYAKNSWLANLLLQHLEEYQGDPNLAFKGEALDLLNRKAGKPIHKVTIYEEIGKKIDLHGKLLEGDKGTNLFFVIYENTSTGQRVLTKKSTVPLMEAIERLANKWPVAEALEGHRPIILSPNDLVYVPEIGEDVSNITWENLTKIQQRIYKVVSFTKQECHFVPHHIARPLDDKNRELGSNNKSERAWDGQMIKNTCIKIKVDRLGNIIEANGRKVIHHQEINPSHQPETTPEP